MKTPTTLSALLAAALFAMPALGQTMTPRHAPYDPGNVETVAGTVTDIVMHPSPKGDHYGVHLTLDVQGSPLPIHMGPAWYLERQDSHIQKGDEIEVIGTRIMDGGAPAIIAGSIKRGEMTLKLRGEDGLPMWRGWRGGAGMQHGQHKMKPSGEGRR